MGLFSRKPDVEVVVEIGQVATAAEAMVKHLRFVNLASKYDMRMVNMPTPESKVLIMAGRPQKAAAFKARVALYQSLGAL
jgi:hypothetical protein